MYVIEFAPPMRGIEGSFNTIRLGGAWAKRLSGGERVLLIDKKASAVICAALVESVVKGKLNELAVTHAANNHNQAGLPIMGAPQRMIQSMIKRYGPHKCRDNSLCTVIYLRVINHENDLSRRNSSDREVQG